MPISGTDAAPKLKASGTSRNSSRVPMPKPASACGPLRATSQVRIIIVPMVCTGEAQAFRPSCSRSRASAGCQVAPRRRRRMRALPLCRYQPSTTVPPA